MRTTLAQARTLLVELVDDLAHEAVETIGIAARGHDGRVLTLWAGADATVAAGLANGLAADVLFDTLKRNGKSAL